MSSLVENNSGIEVGPARPLEQPIRTLSRRHIDRRSEHGLLVVLNEFMERAIPKSGSEPFLRIDHDIGRLEITMNDPFGVRGHRASQTCRIYAPRPPGSAWCFFEDARKVAAFDILHSDEAGPIRHTQIEDADNIRCVTCRASTSSCLKRRNTDGSLANCGE